MKRKRLEVEGGELLLKSKEGHYAIIPAKYRTEVLDMIRTKSYGCINALCAKLPKSFDL